MADPLLSGMRMLVLEDEYLIAMEVEQICREHGATDVIIMRSLDELDAVCPADAGINAAIIDVMLGGTSTIDFASRLIASSIPFVFATGYVQNESFFEAFPGVAVVAKPYGGDSLIEAVANAIRRSRTNSGGV